MRKRQWSFLVLLLSLVPCAAQAQIVEINPNRPGLQAAEENKPELFGRGLLDVNASGQVEASTSVLKIEIGEPDGFHLPFYLLTGATSTTFGKGEQNAETVASLINPTGGFINAFVNGYVPLYQTRTGITRLQLSMMAGAKGVSGRDTVNDKVNVVAAAYADGGILFQTGAWESNGTYSDGGVFWVQLLYAGSISSTTKLQDLFGPDADNPYGLRAEAGIQIKNRVNIKASVFIPQGGKKLPTLNTSALRIALDYKVAN